MHKSKARREAMRLEREKRTQRKMENRRRQAVLEKRLRSQFRTERMINAAAISAFILGFLLWTERLCYPLGGAVQIALLFSNILLIISAYRLPDRRRTEAIWIAELMLPYEVLTLIFLRQPSRYVCLEAHLPVPAILLFLALGLSLIPLLRHLRGRRRLLPHALILAALLFAFSFLWTEAINTSLDFHPAQEIAAERIDRRTGTSGRGAAYYQIKLAFPLSDGSRTTHWFDVTRSQYFDQSSLLLRRPGALGIIWYEPFFPE